MGWPDVGSASPANILDVQGRDRPDPA